MVNFVGTPDQLVFSGGTGSFFPTRFSGVAATLVFNGGTATVGPGTNLVPQTAVPNLNRIMRQEEIVTPSRTASQRLQIIWQSTMEAIESAFSNQQGQITDLASIVARLEAAEAQAAAAQQQATETAQAGALAASYITPAAALSATSAGVITVTAHTRTYGGGTAVSVDGGSLSGFSQGDYVQVYYDDAARAGGAVTYQGTTSVIAQEGARHIVGGVTIPTAGGVPSSGVSPYPPGYIPDYEYYR